MPTEDTNEEKTYTHCLSCASCHNKFTLDSPHDNNTKLNLPDRFCPNCGKKEVELDISIFPNSKPSLDSQRKMNVQMTSEALHLAGRQKDTDRVYNPDVEVISTQRGSAGRGARVPKRVVESLKEKMTVELES